MNVLNLLGAYTKQYKIQGTLSWALNCIKIFNHLPTLSYSCSTTWNVVQKLCRNHLFVWVEII